MTDKTRKTKNKFPLCAMQYNYLYRR